MTRFNFDKKKIVQLRKKTKLSRYKFGLELSTSSHVIKGWEEGTAIPSIPKLEMICNRFEMEPNDLFRRRS